MHGSRVGRSSGTVRRGPKSSCSYAPRYRQQGLPITSSLVESLVGEMNARVKSREKFWNRPEGAEVILQLRPAVSPARAADHQQPGGIVGGRNECTGQESGEVLEPSGGGRSHLAVTRRGIASKGCRSPAAWWNRWWAK